MAHGELFDWDPRDSSVLDDQRGAYDVMREQCPVANSEFLGWSLFRHNDIARVLADPETFSSASHHRAVPNSLDPPEHARYREVLDRYFAAGPMQAFEPACRAIATEVVQSRTGQGEVEFVSEVAEPFSLRSLCAFMGWPEESWEYLLGWTQGNQQVAFSRDRNTGAALATQFSDYVLDAAKTRRNDGPDSPGDVMSRLMAETVDGNHLSDEDLVSALRNWTAGHGTVVAGLSILGLHLAHDQALQLRLRDDPSLVAAAADEVLRADGPLVANRRTATRDVEIGDRSIGAGEKLTLMWMAANRDGDAFDEAEEIRLDRDQGENFLYGHGIHICVGAPLARLELRVALEALLAGTSSIEPGAGESVRRVVYPSNGLDRLPVIFR